MKKLGFNIHPHGMPAGDQARLDRAVDALDSAACLVLDDAAYAHRFKLRHPGTETILRLMPEWGGSDDWLTAGQAWRHADFYRRMVTDLRIICHGRNEPQPPFGDDAVQFALNFGQECLKFGLRAVLMNISVGTLPKDQVGRLRPVIDLINANPGRLYLGVHAYTPPDWRKYREWLLGNFLYIHGYCDAEGIERPEIIFTEGGYDTVWDREKGAGSWDVERACALLGQEQAARNLIDGWNGTMQGLDNVVAFLFYAAGGYGTVWNRFNALDLKHQVFFDTLVAEWPEPVGKEPEYVAPPAWWVYLVALLRWIGLDV